MEKKEERKIIWRIFLVTHWLRIPTSTAAGVNSNPGQGTKVLQKAARKKEKTKALSPKQQWPKNPRETVLKKINRGKIIWEDK